MSMCCDGAFLESFDENELGLAELLCLHWSVFSGMAFN